MSAKHRLLQSAIAFVTIVALGAGYAADVSAQTSEEDTIGAIEGTVSSGTLILLPPTGGDPIGEGGLILTGVPTDPIVITAAPVAAPPVGNVDLTHPTTVIGRIPTVAAISGCGPNGDWESLCTGDGPNR